MRTATAILLTQATVLGSDVYRWCVLGITNAVRDHELLAAHCERCALDDEVAGSQQLEELNRPGFAGGSVHWVPASARTCSG